MEIAIVNPSNALRRRPLPPGLAACQLAAPGDETHASLAGDMKILVLGCGMAARHAAAETLAPWADAEPAQPAASQRTDSAIAVSDDGERWVLLNASSDIGQQLRNSPPLRARPGGASPIEAVVLLDADIDALEGLTGLLGLRGGMPLRVCATPGVFEDLTTGLSMREVLEDFSGLRWQVLPVAGDQGRADFQVPGLDGLRFTAMAVPGRAALRSHRREPQAGDHIAVQIEDRRNGQRLFYAPGPVGRDAATLALMDAADCWLVDGCASVRDGMEIAL